MILCDELQFCLLAEIEISGLFCFMTFCMVVIVAAAIGVLLVGPGNLVNSSPSFSFGAFRPRMRVLNIVAEHFNGQLYDASNGTKNLAFESYGRSIRATFYTGPGGDSLQVCMMWPDSSFRMNILGETFQSRTKSFFRQIQDIKVNDRSFDDLYLLQSNDEGRFLELMTPETRREIDVFFRFGNQHRVNDFCQLFINGGVLCLRRPIPRKDSRSFIATMDQCVNVVRALTPDFDKELDDIVIGNLQERMVAEVAANRQKANSSIELENSKPLLEESVCCLVCGDPIKDQVVFCRTCRTPHHRECWDYFGRCSVYACGEQKHQIL